jgi:hypothetical protein
LAHDTAPPQVRPTRSAAQLSPPSLVILAAVALAVTAQGAFYPPAQVLVGAVLATVGLTVIARPSMARLPVCPLAYAAAGLAGWAVLSAAVAGDVRRALGLVSLLAGMAVVIAVVARRGAAERELLCTVAVGLGALAALAGWVGVAWHMSPWALVDGGLWRAAGTVTYANAAAGLLAPLALLTTALLAGKPLPLLAPAACLLLTGLGATLSRGGLLAFAVGMAVLAYVLGWRRLVSVATGPVLGAAVALAGLAPSVRAEGSPRPGLALAALVAGLVVAFLVRPGLLPPVPALLLAVPVALAGLVGLRGSGRLTLDSRDRVGEARAALDLAAGHPVAGVGPGWKNFVLTDADGGRRVAKYVHNEYLEILAELGIVGLALFLALLASIGVVVWRSRRTAPTPEIWAGVAAGLVCAATAAAFDFGWHVPALPLTSALLIGIVLSTREKEPA